MSPVKLVAKGLDRLSQLDSLYQREMPQSDSSLFAAAQYHFQNPGKSFRAQLALTSASGLNLDGQDSLHWAAACELLHNASLIHDDISDASTHRRGQASINEYFGSDMALCLGDWMVAKSFELAARNKTNGSQLVVLLAQAMQETCSGQMSDINQRQCAVLSAWEQIAKSKTAPLLIAPIKGAAICAGLDDKSDVLERLVGFCALSYQGRNDINDIVPSSHRSSDLDGRKPNLVISLYADSNAVSSQTFNQWYTSADIDNVSHWQKQIASSETILQANQLVEYWLSQADLLVPLMPNELRAVAEGLVASVKQTAAVERQEQLA
jgi:octaprenyl-diphosphate synthase